MAVEDVRTALGETVLGRDLSPPELAELAAAGSVREVEAGEILIREGEPSGGLFVVLDGEVEILKATPEGRPHCLACLDLGAFLGELGLLRDLPASSSVRATRASRLFALDRETFRQRIAAGDQATLKLSLTLAKVLADRVRRMNDEVVELFDRYDALLDAPEGNREGREELAAFKDKLLSEWNF